jgi:hypothetical protein
MMAASAIKMPILIDDMTEPDRPVTRRELRQELEWLLRHVVTKDDAKAFVTRKDAKAFATKQDLKAYATKDDLAAFGDQLRADFQKALAATRDELRTHFSVTTEAFKDEFRKLYDWSLANFGGLSKRVEAIETGHESRLFSLETRVTSVEHRRKRR